MTSEQIGNEIDALHDEAMRLIDAGRDEEARELERRRDDLTDQLTRMFWEKRR